MDTCKLLCCYCDEPAKYIEPQADGWRSALYCEKHIAWPLGKPKEAARLENEKGQKLLAKAIALKLQHPDLDPFWDGIPYHYYRDIS